MERYISYCCVRFTSHVYHFLFWLKSLTKKKSRTNVRCVALSVSFACKQHSGDDCYPEVTTRTPLVLWEPEAETEKLILKPNSREISSAHNFFISNSISNTVLCKFRSHWTAETLPRYLSLRKLTDGYPMFHNPPGSWWKEVLCDCVLANTAGLLIIKVVMLLFLKSISLRQKVH